MRAEPQLGEDAIRLRKPIPANGGAVIPKNKAGVQPNALPLIAECWKCRGLNILDPNKLDVVPNLADTLFLDDDQDAPNAPGTDDLIRFDVVGDLTELGAYGANFNNCVSQYFLRQAERSISAIHAIAVRRMRIEPTTHIPEVRLLFFPRLGSS